MSYFLKKSIFVLLVIVLVISCIPMEQLNADEPEIKQFNTFVQGGACPEYEMKTVEKNMYMGDNWKVTFYNGDGSPMEGGSNDRFGNPLKEGSIAVDEDVIPMNSTLIIEFSDGQVYEYIGCKEFEACDVGGGINGNEIDVYIPGASQSDLNYLGVKYCKVYLVRN